MEISLTFQENKNKQQITVGDIIRCTSFTYGISFKGHNEISVGWTESNYKSALQYGLKQGNGIDAYDLSRGKALFLVLSMELVEVILPEDLADDRYLGINVKCIRLTTDNKLSRNQERIFFTLHHSMSCLDLGLTYSEKSTIEIIDHINLPVFWDEEVTDEDYVERSF